MSISMGNFGTGMKELSKIFEMIYSSYSSPLIILETIFYFFIFKSITLKSKIINYIAKCTMGVYLVHENIFVRSNLYDYLGVTKLKITSITPFFKMFAIVFCLFITGLIIESIRLVVVKFIYNRKVSTKFREKYRDYFKKLGFNINW